MDFGNTDKLLHLSVRIDEMNPAHTRLSIFTGLAHPDNEVPLQDLTRGKSGELVIDTDALRQFIDLTRPVAITFSESAKGNLPQWVLDAAATRPDTPLEIFLNNIRNNLAGRGTYTLDQIGFKLNVITELSAALLRRKP